MGRFDRERWRRSWQALFETHDLVHNKRETLRIARGDPPLVDGHEGLRSLALGLAVMRSADAGEVVGWTVPK